MGSHARSESTLVRPAVRWRALLLLALVSGACQLSGLVGGRDDDTGGPSTPPEPPGPPPASAPSALAAASGGGQSGVVDEPLDQPYAARVTDDDGVPIAGVTVRWEVVSGGGSVSPVSGVTDASGVARSVHRLGTTTGTQRVRALVTSTPSLTAVFESTARHGAVDELVFETDASDVAASAPISPAIRLVLRDRFGNVATSVDGTATIGITPGTGPLVALIAGSLEVSVSNGRATFADVRLGVPGEGYRLRVLTGSRTVDTRPFAVTLVGFE
jgi:hypothetical protein